MPPHPGADGDHEYLYETQDSCEAFQRECFDAAVRVSEELGLKFDRFCFDGNIERIGAQACEPFSFYSGVEGAGGMQRLWETDSAPYGVLALVW